MKYYTYVSDAKLDMLFAQIPSRVSKRLSAELKVDFKVVSLTLKPESEPITRYGKSRIGSPASGSSPPGSSSVKFELQPRPGRDHFHEAHLDPVVGLAPVLLGGIPDTLVVEPQRGARRLDVARRVDHPKRIRPAPDRVIRLDVAAARGVVVFRPGASISWDAR
jgi:Family of unknown function (DUF7019)